jgi:hypothetical protein
MAPAIFNVPWLTGGRMGRGLDVRTTVAPAGVPGTRLATRRANTTAPADITPGPVRVR